MSEIKRYDTFGEGEFMYPFEDGGYVRFDEHQSAIDRLTAERDAAVATQERLRSVITYALSQHNYGGHPLQNHWAANAMNELSAIDAEMKEQEQGQ